MTFYLGFDGGGTKTECVVLDERGQLAGRAVAGPSNALRIGFETACQNLREAANDALTAARADASQVRGACAGLAGAGNRRVVKRIMAFLVNVFPQADVHVTTDSMIALEAAAGAGPGVILIAGTGSICMGRNAAGHFARAGGMGPWISDEGSAFDIGRRAVIAVARARDALGPVTLLAEMIPNVLEVASWEDLVSRIMEAPDQVFPRIFPVVVEAAELGDDPAREILFAAAMGLSQIAASVIRRLGMENEEFVLAKTGGVFGHGPFLEQALDVLLTSAARRAKITRLEVSPAVGAARWAMRLAGEGAKQVHGAKV